MCPLPAQPLAPLALSLEGTVLGASQITWVGGRTVLSAIASCSLLALSASQVPIPAPPGPCSSWPQVVSAFRFLCLAGFGKPCLAWCS